MKSTEDTGEETGMQGGGGGGRDGEAGSEGGLKADPSEGKRCDGGGDRGGDGIGGDREGCVGGSSGAGGDETIRRAQSLLLDMQVDMVVPEAERMDLAQLAVKNPALHCQIMAHAEKAEAEKAEAEKAADGMGATVTPVSFSPLPPADVAAAGAAGGGGGAAAAGDDDDDVVASSASTTAPVAMPPMQSNKAYKGVARVGAQWVASIKVRGGSDRNLGSFSSPVEVRNEKTYRGGGEGRAFSPFLGRTMRSY